MFSPISAVRLLCTESIFKRGWVGRQARGGLIGPTSRTWLIHSNLKALGLRYLVLTPYQKTVWPYDESPMKFGRRGWMPVTVLLTCELNQ